MLLLKTRSVLFLPPAQAAGNKEYLPHVKGFSGGTVGRESPANAGDERYAGSFPRLGRSPGGGNGNPLQYSSKLHHCYMENTSL